MASVSTTQLSSKGQVVIPQEIRARLGLKAGSRFVVVAERGVVIFKTIDAPDLSGMDALLKRAKSQARKAGVKKSDVSKAIKRARTRD
ncbi:MAG: AbrB/MazE/SpoVT family DNA-binding domain-containing protein [Phycisphaeraceae bacterium]|nr:AbrB/MazE/SpoVT family DNA-binding domain-containing protein [Phycisphaeraceae bacterium]MBX3368519.1 AbrB/MazE/SpoVT family DNA-binding domain-containing protein [Phycisphaeraceae bacterium]